MSKLSRTHQIISLGAGVFSLGAGTLLSSNHKDFGKSLTLATVLTLPTVAGSYWVIDRKANRRISEAQDKAREADTRAKQSEGKASKAKPLCPHCGSANIRSKGDKWVCLNPEHSAVASNKPKSWKK